MARLENRSTFTNFGVGGSFTNEGQTMVVAPTTPVVSTKVYLMKSPLAVLQAEDPGGVCGLGHSTSSAPVPHDA